MSNVEVAQRFNKDSININKSIDIQKLDGSTELAF